MKKNSWLLLVCFISPLHADSTMEFKGLMMEKPAKTWTSGLKQRQEMHVPLLGQLVTITRVDDGVVWTLNPKKKTYSESPIALSYMPESAHKTESSAHNETADAPDEQKCTPDFKKLTQERLIAGQKSSGYKMSCKESPDNSMTTWVAAPSAVASAVMKEQEKFGAAHLKAIYANYPAKERAEMQKGSNFLSGLVQNIPTMMSSGQLPKGLWTSLEMESPEDGKQTVYELVSLSTDKAAPSLFEIPAGYKKVKEGAKPYGMSDVLGSDEVKKGAKEEGFKSLMKGLGNLSN